MLQKQDDPADRWSEGDSTTFIDYGRYHVPERELQIATICGLLPNLPSGLVDRDRIGRHLVGRLARHIGG